MTAEDIPEISKQMNVTSVPTCLMFCKSKELCRVEGTDVSQITTKVKQLAFKVGSNISSLSGTTGSANIEDRLKALTNKCSVMVFMKGNPEAPRCGFSRTLVSILNEINVKYETFDILSDEEVRQSLKTYSNWPTYPQVYVGGNLIGGLDIIKVLLIAFLNFPNYGQNGHNLTPTTNLFVFQELKESGELEEALKG